MNKHEPASLVERPALAEPHPRLGSPIQLRRFSLMPPRALFIGASTGGPQALEVVLSSASNTLRHMPIVVVLHAPPGFMEVVAANVAKAARMPARICLNGERLMPGTIYFAPGDKHVRVMKADKRIVLVHSDGEPQNFCKPAVDVLFRSAARSFGPEALGIVLTGMGRDGLMGAQEIVTCGGSVVVQDEASSVVWGMPGVIARAGLASAVLPVSGISSAIDGLMTASRRSAIA